MAEASPPIAEAAGTVGAVAGDLRTATLDRLQPSRAFAAPVSLAAAIVALCLIPLIRRQPQLVTQLLAAAGAVFVWTAALFARTRDDARRLEIAIVLRPQHYLQACAQGSVLLYWGWHWRAVYDQMPLIAAQLLFAYAFDMLLTWSRQNRYALGFGPFPVIFSINLFLWFKPEWFVLQLLMIAIGFAAKQLITWERDGRRVHVFNPSSFPLAVCSIALILTSTSGYTFGQEIAETFDIPPHIGLWIFLVALPGQFLFGVASMTLAAVATLYAFVLMYFAATGTYFFVDAYIPAAVFLGMHLLFTDPATSPRTESGRLLFGVGYGLGVAVLYAWLDAAGAPTFYDKLLPVPLLNLMVRAIDRSVQSGVLQRWSLARGEHSLTSGRRNFAYIAVWTGVFLLITASDGVGDLRESRSVTALQRACSRGRNDACRLLAPALTHECVAGSAWACNELGILTAEGRATSPLPPAASFGRACDYGLAAGCDNEHLLAAGGKDWRRTGAGPP